MARTTNLITAEDGHSHMTATQGHPQGARVGRRHVRPGAQDDGAASNVLVAPSLLLTTRDVAACVSGARGRVVPVGLPRRAAGCRLALDPDGGFLTSPALGWTLVRVPACGLPTVWLARLPGMHLPPVSCGARIGEGLQWVEGDRIVADVDLRLRVLGGRGRGLRRELGL